MTSLLVPARIGIAAAFCALLVHTIGYAAYLTDPLTWALLAVGGVLAAEAGAGELAPARPTRAMTGYLRRLATTGAAYTASSVISKLIAVALLPLYTRYLTPADYGAAEVLITGVIAASIVIRLGIIEALLRFYYQAGRGAGRRW